MKRAIYTTILNRLTEPRKFIQVILGPRQVGKTTLARQVMEHSNIPSLYGSADDISPPNDIWISQQWELARIKVKDNPKKEILLVLDEIQKISHWSETIKRLWDEDTKNGLNVKLLLLGSSALLLHHGLSESLAGRFEIIRAVHWSFPEMQEAFGWNLDQYIYFGGYPGSAHLIDDEPRWREYILHALIETTVSKDILLTTSVQKPALLRQLFQLGCNYSSQILSYQKMLGQLQDAGNTTTLAHYLNLLSTAGLITGLEKFSLKIIKQRNSSPKLQVLNTALISAQSALSFEETRRDFSYWGRLTESTIGAYLVNSAISNNIEVTYWRDAGKEVDFILKKGEKIVAIEVKTSHRKFSLPGLGAFEKKFNPSRLLLIGENGFPVEEFFKTPMTYWFE